MSEPRNFSIVCLSSQDWRINLPTNRQQIMLRAARRGHDVLFVETGNFVGVHVWHLLTRKNRGSLARRLLVGERVEAGITSRKAINLFPWGQKFEFASHLNSTLNAALLRLVARRRREPDVLWIYDPCAAWIAGKSGEAIAAYDCVDDYAEQVGGDRRRKAVVSAGDRRAALSSQVVFTTTRPLFERHRALNPDTHLVPNGADFEHFSRVATTTDLPPELRDLPRPILGFAGNFGAGKVDFDLIEQLASTKPGWTILLIGPADARAAEALRGLGKRSNVNWLGPRRYEELPRYVAAFDIGLIPYVTNQYTRSCFPLKVFEYLAAGKPIVATGLPELGEMEPDVVLASGLDEFVDAIERLKTSTEEDRKRRMELAAANTWETRANRLLELVGSELSRGGYAATGRNGSVVS